MIFNGIQRRRYEGYDPKSEGSLKQKIASVLYKDMIKADEGNEP
jgi:hypothetical protein